MYNIYNLFDDDDILIFVTPFSYREILLKLYLIILNRIKILHEICSREVIIY